MKNSFGFLSVASLVSVLSACGDTAWMRVLDSADASATGIPCSGAAEFASASCGAIIDRNNPCVPGTAGLYCQGGFLVPDSCHVLNGYTCHPGASNPLPPVDAGTTQPVVCAPRSEVPSSFCDNGTCQNGVMGLTCSADGLGFIPGCHLLAGYQCRPVTTPPVDAGTTPVDVGTTPVDTGTAPVDTGLATDGQIEVAIDQTYFAVVRNADGSSTGTAWCGGNAGSINLRCFDRTGEQIRTPLAGRRVIAIDSSWVGAMRCDVTCGSSADAPVYPFPTGWRDSRYPIGSRGITVATVGRDGIGDVRASALYCNAPGGIKIEIPVQASFIGRCLQ